MKEKITFLGRHETALIPDAHVRDAFVGIVSYVRSDVENIFAATDESVPFKEKQDAGIDIGFVNLTPQKLTTFNTYVKHMYSVEYALLKTLGLSQSPSPVVQMLCDRYLCANDAGLLIDNDLFYPVFSILHLADASLDPDDFNEKQYNTFKGFIADVTPKLIDHAHGSLII